MTDDLRAARGIALAIAVCCPVWMVVIWGLM